MTELPGEAAGPAATAEKDTALLVAPKRAGSEPLDSSGEPAVRLEHVSRHFGDVVAVDDVNLELAAGEFFTLLGPSGCGKTTTLRMVGGFELPSAGRILLDGKDVSQLPPYRRDVNTVFQSYALFPHLSVFDNVAFGLRRQGLDKAEISRRVGYNLELLGLKGLERRRPAKLSGGQQQRVAVARALVNEPKVLLLDEPMGALDARIRKVTQLELKRIQREVGITFLYVTHDQAEAMAMSDRLAVMHAGHCEDVGPPARLYNHPKTKIAAEFLGPCNWMPVVVDSDGLRLPDGTSISVEHADAHRITGTDWMVGVRPEKFVVSLNPAAAVETGSRANVLRTRVLTATYLGASTEYELETPWRSVIVAYAQNLDESSRAQPGEDVEVSWDAANCFLIPPEDGAK